MSMASTFKSLHQQPEIFVLPNAWDIISAMVLEQVGFKAIGTTSWGVSNSFGYKDGENIGFDTLVALAGKMVEAVNIPVSVDIESGYAEDGETVANNVLKIADIGAAGINIEDSLKHSHGLQDQQTQCAIIEKIRKRLDDTGHKDFFINARIDSVFQERPFTETLSRATSYISHGASGVFVPGLSDEDQIKELVKTVSAPVNIMSLPHLTDANALGKLGVRRFSIGNALSDATIAFIEERALGLMTSLNTDHLYGGSAVRTSFR